MKKLSLINFWNYSPVMNDYDGVMWKLNKSKLFFIFVGHLVTSIKQFVEMNLDAGSLETHGVGGIGSNPFTA